MLNAISKLIIIALFGVFLIWATYKIGAGLDYWGPFVMAIIGLVGGLIYSIAKIIISKKSTKQAGKH